MELSNANKVTEECHNIESQQTNGPNRRSQLYILHIKRAF